MLVDWLLHRWPEPKDRRHLLRLWVAASDYSDDLQIGPGILKNFAESYRKMRNTLRWMLGTLGHFGVDASGSQNRAPAGSVAYADMPSLEKFMSASPRIT